MSKTIQLFSRHKGRIATKVKGESVSIVFNDTKDPNVFMAEVDNDEAGALLGIGLPDYWKEKIDADAGSEAGKEGDVKLPNAAAMIEKIRAAATIEELEDLLAEEEAIGVATGNGPRKSVTDEAAKRSKKITE